MKRFTAAIALWLATSASAQAFTILSPITEGCHERLLLGSLNNEKTGFASSSTPSTAAFLARFIARVPASQIPTDRLTQGLINEMTNRYGWQDLDLPTRYVLASFVAGVRAPDTDGFSVANFNDLRGTQIRDEDQPAHSLRTKEDDNASGNQSAIQRARDQITSELNQVLTEWNAPGAPLGTERWTFAFYGSQDVTVIQPAYHLGFIVHAIQDSYAHTIRDENFQIIAVANYLDVMLDQFNEARDGPPHSDRLDQCNLQDDFDAMRITEVRTRTAEFLNQVDAVLSTNGTDLTAVQAKLDTIYAYRSGCDLSNKYCGANWYTKAMEDTSQPYNIGVGCGAITPERRPPPSSGAAAALLLSIPLAFAFWWRRKFVLKGSK